MASPTELCVRFLCALRGYHVYKKDWTPRLNEVLSAVHEVSNIYDRYVIAAKKKLPGQLAPQLLDTCQRKFQDLLDLSFSMEQQ